MSTKILYQIFSLVNLVILSCSSLATSVGSNDVQAAGEIRVIPKRYQQQYDVIQWHSKVLAEDREMFIHLPDDYRDSQKRYPVLYLLDGSRHLPHALLAEDILQAESLMPQSIIVAIPNLPGTRTRDLSREKDKFIQFISQEVKDLVYKRYRAARHQTIFGHSMAGYFVMNVLATQPALFDNYIAASPVVQMNDSELVKKFAKLELAVKHTQKSLFLTLTQQASEGARATKALARLVELLNKKTIAKLSWRYEYIPNQIHMTTPYLTLYQGLSFVYDDYQMPTFNNFKEFKRFGGMPGLKEYYANRASKYHIKDAVPERAIRSVGFALMDDGHSDEALMILEQNVQKHPNSFAALNALAQAFEDAKSPNKALEIYQKALTLAKQQSSRNSGYFERQVSRIKGQSN